MTDSIFIDSIESRMPRSPSDLPINVVDPHEFVRAAFNAEGSRVILKPPGFKKQGAYILIDLSSIMDARDAGSYILRQMHEALSDSANNTGQEEQREQEDQTLWQALLWRWWLEKLCEKPQLASISTHQSATANTKSGSTDDTQSPTGENETNILIGKIFETEIPKPDTEESRVLYQQESLGQEKEGTDELVNTIRHALTHGEGKSDILHLLSAETERRKKSARKENVVLCFYGLDEVNSDLSRRIAETIQHAHKALDLEASLVFSRRRIGFNEFQILLYPTFAEKTRWVALPLFLLPDTINEPNAETKSSASSDEPRGRHPITAAIEDDIDALRILNAAAEHSLCKMLDIARKIVRLSDRLDPSDRKAFDEMEAEARFRFALPVHSKSSVYRTHLTLPHRTKDKNPGSSHGTEEANNVPPKRILDMATTKSDKSVASTQEASNSSNERPRQRDIATLVFYACLEYRFPEFLSAMEVSDTGARRGLSLLRRLVREGEGTALAGSDPEFEKYSGDRLFRSFVRRSLGGDLLNDGRIGRRGWTGAAVMSSTTALIQQLADSRRSANSDLGNTRPASEDLMVFERELSAYLTSVETSLTRRSRSKEHIASRETKIRSALQEIANGNLKSAIVTLGSIEENPSEIAPPNTSRTPQDLARSAFNAGLKFAKSASFEEEGSIWLFERCAVVEFLIALCIGDSVNDDSMICAHEFLKPHFDDLKRRLTQLDNFIPSESLPLSRHLAFIAGSLGRLTSETLSHTNLASAVESDLKNSASERSELEMRILHLEEKLSAVNHIRELVPIPSTKPSEEDISPSTEGSVGHSSPFGDPRPPLHDLATFFDKESADILAELSKSERQLSQAMASLSASANGLVKLQTRVSAFGQLQKTLETVSLPENGAQNRDTVEHTLAIREASNRLATMAFDTHPDWDKEVALEKMYSQTVNRLYDSSQDATQSIDALRKLAETALSGQYVETALRASAFCSVLRDHAGAGGTQGSTDRRDPLFDPFARGMLLLGVLNLRSMTTRKSKGVGFFVSYRRQDSINFVLGGPLQNLGAWIDFEQIRADVGDRATDTPTSVSVANTPTGDAASKDPAGESSKEALVGGERDWRIALLSALQDSTRIVIFFSLGYFRSAPCITELYSAALASVARSVRISWVAVDWSSFSIDEQKSPHSADRRMDADALRDLVRVWAKIGANRADSTSLERVLSASPLVDFPVSPYLQGDIKRVQDKLTEWIGFGVASRW